MNIAKLLKRYNEATEINDHNEASLILVKAFGTVEELNTIYSLIRKQEIQGYLTQEQTRERYKCSNKYHKLLIKLK